MNVEKNMKTDLALRKHLIELLDGAQAHATFDNVVGDFPEKFRGKTPSGLPHSGWMLLEHLRIAQHDILDFSRNAEYTALKWAAHYWPKQPAPPSAATWDGSAKRC